MDVVARPLELDLKTPPEVRVHLSEAGSWLDRLATKGKRAEPRWPSTTPKQLEHLPESEQKLFINRTMRIYILSNIFKLLR